MNFRKKFFGHSRIENLLDGNIRTVHFAFVNCWETSLSNLLTDLKFINRNFTDSWHSRQSSSAHRNCLSLRETWEFLFLNFSFQVLNFLHKLYLIFLLILKLFFQVFRSVILRCCCGAFKTLIELHPIGAAARAHCLRVRRSIRSCAASAFLQVVVFFF